MYRSLLNAVLFFSSVSVIGCGGSSVKDAPRDIPGWALAQPPLCGVGTAKFRGNLGMTKTTAETAARADLSRQIETKVKDMVTTYASEGETANGEFSEQKNVNVSQALSKNTLVGSRPKKAHMAKDNQYYSLVCLEPDVLTKAFEGMKQLSATARKALANRAKKAHEDLDEAMEKYDE
jgi:hypothetical protein